MSITGDGHLHSTAPQHEGGPVGPVDGGAALGLVPTALAGVETALCRRLGGGGNVQNRSAVSWWMFLSYACYL